MEFSNYIAALKRRWPYMLASIAIICGIVLYHVATTDPTPVYKAESRIFVASASQVSADDISQLAASAQVAKMTYDFMTDPGTEIALRFAEPLAPETIIQRVRAETVGGGQNNTKSSVVRITAFATNGGDAVRLANATADNAKLQALELTQLGTSKVGDYLEVQLKDAKRRLEVSRTNLEQFNSRNKEMVVPLDSNQARDAVASLQDLASKAQSEISENQRRVAQLRRSLGQRGGRKVDPEASPSAAVVEALKSQIASNELQLIDLRQKYTEKHPRVIAVQNSIENAKTRLKQESEKAFSLENSPTSMEYQFLAGDIARYETEKYAAEAKTRAINQQLARARTQLGLVPQLEVEANKLNVEYVAAQENYMNLQKKYDDALVQIRIAQNQQADRMGIGMVDYAATSTETPGSKLQKPIVKLVMAFIIACIVGMGIILFLEGIDTSIRDVDQVEDRYQLPVLGVIPTLRETQLKGGSTLILRDAPDSPFSDPYRIMRTNFLALASQSGSRSIVVTSTLPGEGKSTTASNFAASLAESHNTVCLIDADMRNPTQHRIFGVDKEPGLSNFLCGEHELEDVLFPTNMPKLTLISAGTIPENASRLITGHRMRDLLDMLVQRFDYVIIDTPPAVAFSDAMDLGALVDSMVVVVGAGSKLESAHFRARSNLANVRAELVGTVLNRVQPTEVDSYRYSSRYYPKLGSRDWENRPRGNQQALPEDPEEHVSPNGTHG